MGVQVHGLRCMMLHAAAPTLAFGNHSAQDCRLGGALMAVLCLHRIVASQVTIISLSLVPFTTPASACTNCEILQA